jgi:hypothetical protein
MSRWLLIMVRHGGRGPALAPSDADAPLACTLACIIVTQTTHLIALPFLEHDVTVRAELFIVGDARSADLEKSHDVLLWCSVMQDR